MEQGSILDEERVGALGRFDIVYSFGVLHHTGQLWTALDHAASLVNPGGQLCIALYNDQGRMSRYWKWVKRAYCKAPVPLKPLVLGPAAVQLWGPRMLLDLAHAKPFASWRQYGRRRGMSPWRDVVDWVGGYPFEVSSPDSVFRFCRARGFELRHLKSTTGSGNNHYVFELPNAV